MCSHGGGGHGHGGCSHEMTVEDTEFVQYNMVSSIDLERVTVLGEAVDGSGKKVFKAWEDRFDRSVFVESDDDPELLFNIPFKGHVKITGITLIGDEDDTFPGKMRLYKDRPSMSCEDMGLPADQEFDLKQDEKAGIDYPLRAAKFNSISHLTIHFPSNFGEKRDNDVNTRIYYIGIRGEFQKDFRQQVTICTYESRPQMKDHKTDAQDAVGRHIF
uniref:PITH domain-containing protein n=1 Tax=Steinernema glaseri TaxID=37863 RepID=A0A1I7Z284_9BILA